MSRRNLVETLTLSLVGWAVAVLLACAFMSLVCCGHGSPQTCPRPRLADSAGPSASSNQCEVRK